MVLGLKSKHKKDGSVQLNYLVHVQELKPWLPSSQTLAIQWQNGEQTTGFLSPNVIDSTIDFNKSFVFSTTLRRVKKDRDKFQKNYLEFHLYQPRKDKPHKDELLGSAIVNLGDYGIIDNVLNLSVPFIWKKSSKSVVEPALFISLQLNDKDETNSSRSSLSKQSSLDKYGQESASEATNEENEELDIAAFTDDDDDDDDDYRHSSSTSIKDTVDITKQGNGQQSAYSLGPGPPVSSSSKFSERSMTTVRKGAPAPVLKSSFSTMGSPNTNIEPKTHTRISEPENRNHTLQENSKLNPQPVITNSVTEAQIVESSYDQDAKSESGQDNKTPEEKKQISEDNLVGKFLASRKQDKLRSNTLSRKPPGGQGSGVSANKLKHLNSVQLPKVGGFSGNGLPASSPNRADKDKVIPVNNSTETGVSKSESSNGKSGNRGRIEMLEEELRETAAIESGLYSIVAEHGSSTNKVHAPARRLSRFYLHTCKEKDQERRVNAARAIISGLVLVSKSCGNDVPRLTFWLSNAVMLRGIVFQTVEGNQKHSFRKVSDDWRDPQTFIIALEKIEAWMFSRIIESVWWQTLTPHMQPAATNASSKTIGLTSKKTSASKNGLGNQQGNFSVELWKKAFRDTCERLCPIRAGGHECGCLPMLPRLVMEQLVGRLDVAMFNAILRDSDDEMPTDPLSDPIGDLRVLPIPAGKSSFGAGAQLKNTIGTWSRWLTDLFGIEENDTHEDSDDHIANNKKETSFKAFRLLHALSDLMMLPFEMLADKSTRKEVCPIFATPLIRRVVFSFVPDEFSPNPIPNSLIEALDAEDDETEAFEGSLINVPCSAPSPSYGAPSSQSLSPIIGAALATSSLRRSSSSVLKKSYTSDDELDELDSPLSSILTDGSRVSPSSKGVQWCPKGGRNIVRYQLLREIWKDSE
ncbi:uncharacterized protein [Rutidosis leptorrhynchoides]|uniref:uncharacterized protein n=1 Tax=Rutidosis leptorrhynchoides TaxID=125765 RepID=UPI003A9A0748